MYRPRVLLPRFLLLDAQIMAHLVILLLIIMKEGNEEQGTEGWVDHHSVQAPCNSRGIIAMSLRHRGMYHERSWATALNKWDYYKDYYLASRFLLLRLMGR
jgi:hypothetical protein